jgi:hypothetical protein
MNVRMLALCGFVGLGLGACVDDGSDAPLRIIGNVAPGEGCSIDSASTTFQDDGVIEASSIIGYVFTPSVRNDLQIVGDEAIGPKTIYVTHAKVEIQFYDPDFENVTTDSSLLKFQVPTSGAVDPDGGTSAFSFEIVPPELLSLIGARLGQPTATNPLPRTVLDARVQMVGSRGGGGGEVTSNVFRYPVEVCNGCVQVELGDCALLTTGFMGSTGGACNALQDGVLECCNGGEVCPAAPPPAAAN